MDKESNEYLQLSSQPDEQEEPPLSQKPVSRKAISLVKLYITLAVLMMVTVPSMAVLYIISGDPAELPPGYHDVLFESRIFQRTSTEESKKAWECLPNGNGLVLLSSSSLPPGLPSDDHGGRNLYGISWAHQLYCLTVVRDEFYALKENYRTVRFLNKDPLGGDETYRLHIIEECYDYLRQRIMCTGDMSIEWPTSGESELGGHGRIDGFGAEHQCREKVCIDLTKTHEHLLTDTSEVPDRRLV